MEYTQSTCALTHAGALVMLTAAVASAEASGQPQCIVIVDASGVTLAELRMTGAKFLSLKSAASKARTAASTDRSSDAINEAVRNAIALATGGHVTALPGGLPIRFDGVLVGGIGVGSGTGEQDVAVARAALLAVGADL